MERTAEASPVGADLAVVAKKQVCGAHEPVFVRGVQLDGIAHSQNTHATDQRHVVVVNDVGRTAAGPLEQSPELPTVENWVARLLHEQYLGLVEPAAKSVDGDPSCARGFMPDVDRGFAAPWAEQRERARGVYDGNIVASTCQSLCQSLHLYAITAEGVWRVEGCHEDDRQRVAMIIRKRYERARLAPGRLYRKRHVWIGGLGGMVDKGYWRR